VYQKYRLFDDISENSWQWTCSSCTSVHIDKDGLWLISTCGNMYPHHASHQVLVACPVSYKCNIHMRLSVHVDLRCRDVDCAYCSTPHVSALPCKPWMLCVFVPWSPSACLERLEQYNILLCNLYKWGRTGANDTVQCSIVMQFVQMTSSFVQMRGGTKCLCLPCIL